MKKKCINQQFYKKSQANIIVSVLLILLVLGATAIVWNLLNSIVSDSSDQVNIDFIGSRLEVEDANIWISGGAQVNVRREGGGDAQIQEIIFNFKNEDGSSFQISETTTIPTQSETITYDFTASQLASGYTSKIRTVSIAPKFSENSIGLENTEDVNSFQKDEFTGFRVPENPDSSAGTDNFNDLQHWWPLDETSGTDVKNKITTAVGGTIINNVNFIPDANRGDTINFDPSVGGIEGHIITSSTSNPTSSFTLSMWVKSDVSNSYEGSASIDQFLSKDDTFKFGTPGGDPDQICFQFFDSSSWVGGTCELAISNTNQWHHFVGTYDGTNKILYRDGVAITVPPYNPGGNTISINNNPYEIAKRADQTQYFDGSISDVMVFNQALDADEVNQLYHNTKELV